jgi:hypothetical protein
MITLPSYLAIRTISGRDGEFNVEQLSTSIGEFVIKDALMDQHHKSKYRGDFVFTEIRPSYYTNGERLVVDHSWPDRSVTNQATRTLLILRHQTQPNMDLAVPGIILLL